MFKDVLKELRKSKRITQEELAHLVRVERSTVGKWESKNIIPSADMLIELSNYFDTSVDVLLGVENNEIGAAIKKEREEQGLSVKELAEELQISVKDVLELETNGLLDNSKELVGRLEEVFGMTWVDFLEKYDLYDEYIDPNLGDAAKNEDLKKSVYEDAMKDSNKKYAIDTVAAHLEGKNLTPKKLKLLEQYIDALFDEDDE